MPDTENSLKDKALHQLMEDEFQQLVDIIEQKKMVHEDIDLNPPPESDPILDSTLRLQGQSEELGADTLAEFFHALEGSARNGKLSESTELLQNISTEFESVKKILDKD